MRCVTKLPGLPPEVQDLPDTLEAMQAFVGGYIELVPIGPGIDVLCHEEGLLRNLPVNCGFAGPIAITAIDPVAGEHRDLTEEEVRKALAWMRLHEHDILVNPSASPELITFDTTTHFLWLHNRTRDQEWAAL